MRMEVVVMRFAVSVALTSLFACTLFSSCTRSAEPAKPPTQEKAVEATPAEPTEVAPAREATQPAAVEKEPGATSPNPQGEEAATRQSEERNEGSTTDQPAEKAETAPAQEAENTEDVMSQQAKKAAEFLARYNSDYEQREGAVAGAYWVAANSGAKEDFDKFADADLALKMLHADGERYKVLIALLETPQAYDALTLRSLKLAELMFRGNQLPADLLEKMVKASAEIEQTFNTFRGTFEGEKKTNNDLLDVLAREKDSERRRAAWEGLKEVGEAVAPKLIALAKLRNEAARSLGFENFWDMQVRLQEHDPAMLLSIFDNLEKSTNEAFREQKAGIDAHLAQVFGIAPEAVMPWHYDNPFFQQAPPSEELDLDVFYENKTREDLVALAVRFYGDIGLPMEDLAAKSDFYEREGKDQHAFCISMNRADDVRMLLNVKPTAEWMDTMLHESGHAVYYKFVNRELPFNLREAAHIFTTEAVAMLFGALAKNPTWLVDYAGADGEKVKALAGPLAQQRKREQLIFARWTLVMLNFEKALYENPEQDLNTLWWDMVERYQFLKRPEGRTQADWASKPHFTIAPVYYHNYMLGELFAAQLRGKLSQMANHQGPTSTLSFTGKHDFGLFLIESVFRPGMTQPWPEFVKEATGKDLGIDDFAKEVSSKE